MYNYKLRRLSVCNDYDKLVRFVKLCVRKVRNDKCSDLSDSLRDTIA